MSRIGAYVTGYLVGLAAAAVCGATTEHRQFWMLAVYFGGLALVSLRGRKVQS
jgi:hypothetical protein